jgi:hypothetical protein
MGAAYTPGLTVAEATIVRRVRRLPLQGRILVSVGQEVQAEDVVAQTDLPGEVRPINVAGQLGIAPEELPELMVKRAGDAVAAGEPFVRTRGLMGMFRRELCSPTVGTIESVSRVTGQVIIRGEPAPLRKLAYISGRVVEVSPGESATIEAVGTYVQGIFGVGGECWGELCLVVNGPDEVLDARAIRDEHADKILVGGRLAPAEAVKKAIQIGAAGIVTGGLHDADLRSFVGCEIGVAITGEETLGLTLVVTEGFGPIAMARRTFELLAGCAGMRGSMNGATQIRAGVIRPEVIVPRPRSASRSGAPVSAGSLEMGAVLRAIREPYFGRMGRCVGLPTELTALESESRARVIEVEFEGGERAVLPRANVELIQR